MRALFLLSAAGLLALSSSAAAPRVPSFALRLKAGETVVAIDGKAPPVVVFAAEELARLLGRALGAKEPLPIVRGKAPGGKKAIFLGDTEAARAAGVEARKMGRDEYRIRLVKDGLVIAGYDDETVDPKSEWTSARFERGTLNGVYGFLEKFAGARFYFPGRLGTIIPTQRHLEIPGKTDLTVRPNFVERTFCAKGKVPEELLGDDTEPAFAQDEKGFVRLWRLRVKEGSFHFPCCHGQENHLFRLQYKVADYPELYALQKDGTRNDKWLCQTNPKVWDLMFDRLRRRRNGEKSKWGDGYWQPHGTDRVTGITYNDIMPSDAMTVACCLCDECKSRYVDRNAGRYNFMLDLEWEKTVEYANRIAAAGFKNEVSPLPQVVAELAECCVAASRIIREAFRQDGGELGVAEELRKVRVTVEGFGGRNLDERSAEGVLVAGEIPGHAILKFRCHVTERAAPCLVSAVRRLGSESESEIADADVAVFVQQQVRGLDVAMGDAVAVGAG